MSFFYKYQKYKQKYLCLKDSQRGGSLSNFSVMSYNVYAGGKFKEHRRDLLISEIIRDSPEIICLQEATDDLITAILKFLPNYYCWTKLETIQEQLTPKELSDTKKSGFLVVLSKWNFLTKELVHSGSWFDDGIMRTVVDSRKSLGYYLVIYNVHLIGGTYGTSETAILEKRRKRIEELHTLKNALSRENEDSNIVIMGDFNSDSNDPTSFPEVNYYPENIFSNYHDIWFELRQLGQDVTNNLQYTGATESHQFNLMRAYLKPSQKRESRFDKIIYKGKNLHPIKINLIGNQLSKWLIDVPIFPSDHFGLKAVIKNS